MNIEYIKSLLRRSGVAARNHNPMSVNSYDWKEILQSIVTLHDVLRDTSRHNAEMLRLSDIKYESTPDNRSRHLADRVIRELADKAIRELNEIGDYKASLQFCTHMKELSHLNYAFNCVYKIGVEESIRKDVYGLDCRDFRPNQGLYTYDTCLTPLANCKQISQQ